MDLDSTVRIDSMFLPASPMAGHQCAYDPIIGHKLDDRWGRECKTGSRRGAPTEVIKRGYRAGGPNDVAVYQIAPWERCKDRLAKSAN